MGGRKRKIDVQEDAFGAADIEPVDQQGVLLPSPRPIANLTKRLVVDQDEDDVAAGAVRMKTVPPNAQIVFRDLAESDEAEDQASDRRPQKQLPWCRLRYGLLALRHVRAFPSQLPLSHARGKVRKSLTALRLTTGSSLFTRSGNGEVAGRRPE